jgi:hypothetical protein
LPAAAVELHAGQTLQHIGYGGRTCALDFFLLDHAHIGQHLAQRLLGAGGGDDNGVELDSISDVRFGKNAGDRQTAQRGEPENLGATKGVGVIVNQHQIPDIIEAALGGYSAATEAA